MSKRIETKKGLQELRRRFKNIAPMSVIDPKHTKDECTAVYWLNVITGCIEDGLAMDEDDYSNTPFEYKRLWKGLK